MKPCLDKEYLFTPESSHTAPLSQVSPKITTFMTFFTTADFCFKTSHIWNNTFFFFNKAILFCVCPFSLSIVSVRQNCDVGVSVVSFTVLPNNPMNEYNNALFTSYSINSHQDCFQLLSIKSKDVAILFLKVFLWAICFHYRCEKQKQI